MIYKSERKLCHEVTRTEDRSNPPQLLPREEPVWFDFRHRSSVLFPNKPQNIIPVCKNQECKKNNHSCNLGIFKELIAWFSSCYTSYSKNITWPPSSAGIGRIFITARIIERKAVRFQKDCQSHTPGNILPIVINPPSDS